MIGLAAVSALEPGPLAITRGPDRKGDDAVIRLGGAIDACYGLRFAHDRWRTDHTAIRSPSLTLFPDVELAVHEADAYAGWYVSNRAATVLVLPGSEGGIRVFGLGRLNGALLRQQGDQFAVGWFDEAPNVLTRTPAVFRRDFASAVIGLDIGLHPERDGTALTRIQLGDARIQKLRFESGGVEFEGHLLLPPGDAYAAAVFIHGTGHATADGAFELGLARGLHRRGVAVALFDKRGSGRSGGDWRRASLSVLADDVLAAVRAVRNVPGVDPQRVGVYGISEGGWISPLVSARDTLLAFIVNHGGPAVSPLEDEMDDLRSGVARLRLADADRAAATELLTAWVELYRSPDAWPRYQAALSAVDSAPWFQPVRSRLPRTEDHWSVQWWRLRGAHDASAAWRARQAPSLVVIGSRDETMDVEKSLRLFRAFASDGPPMEIWELANADHGLRAPGVPMDAYVERLAEWIRSVVR